MFARSSLLETLLNLTALNSSGFPKRVVNSTPWRKKLGRVPHGMKIWGFQSLGIHQKNPQFSIFLWDVPSSSYNSVEQESLGLLKDQRGFFFYNGAKSSMVLKLKNIRVQSQHQAHTQIKPGWVVHQSWGELHRFRTEWAMARWQLEDITDGKNEYGISDDQNMRTIVCLIDPSIKRIWAIIHHNIISLIQTYSN